MDKGRLIYRAWAEDQGKTQDAIIKAVIRTNDLFQSKTGGAITRGVRKAA
jgi:acyl-CoA-binding protein